MPGGRPSKYDPVFVEQVYKLALLGLTDAEMASFFEVDPKTLYNWDAEHPEFLHSRARGKLSADSEVAAKLHERAVGYSHESVKIFMPANAAAPVYAPFVEHYPPDVNAATLWLSNRQGGKWKLKSSTEHTGADGAPLLPALTVTIAKE